MELHRSLRYGATYFGQLLYKRSCVPWCLLLIRWLTTTQLRPCPFLLKQRCWLAARGKQGHQRTQKCSPYEKSTPWQREQIRAALWTPSEQDLLYNPPHGPPKAWTLMIKITVTIKQGPKAFIPSIFSVDVVLHFAHVQFQFLLD